MNTTRYSSLLLILFYALLTYFSQYNVFFGDMVQFGSRHSHYFFENNFSSFWLPNSLDSGHPPIFGMYIALCWKIFGKSLVVSHWAMFPFLILIATAIPRIASNYISTSKILLISLLIYIEPTLLSQATLTSPDIVLISFFLWAIVFYKEEKFILLSLVFIPMSFISLRGMMVLFSFFISIIIHQKKIDKKIIYVIIPAVSICFYWLFWHYQLFGWVGFHSDSPWASSFQSVGFVQIIKNIFLMIWRWADFGRIIIWLIILFYGVYQIKNKIKLSSVQKFPFILLVVLSVVFTANTAFADGLVGHRYYLPIYIVGLVFALQFVEFYSSRKNIYYFSILFAFFLGSNFTYPNHIAMGWDATVAHRPYYELRKKTIDFLTKENIPLHTVGAGFPSLDSREYLELNGDTSAFQSYANPEIEFIIWSNIFNYPDELQDSLVLKKSIFSKEKNGVFMKVIPLK